MIVLRLEYQEEPIIRGPMPVVLKASEEKLKDGSRQGP